MTTRALEPVLIQGFTHFVDYPTVYPDISEEEANTLLAAYQEEPLLQSYLKDKAVSNLAANGDKVCAVFERVVNKLKKEVEIYRRTVTSETGQWNAYKRLFDISAEPRRLADLAQLIKDAERDIDIFTTYLQEKMIEATKIQLNKPDEEEATMPLKCQPSAPDKTHGNFDSSNIVDMDDLEPDPEPEIAEVKPAAAPSFLQNVSACICACFTFLIEQFQSFINWMLD